MTAWNDFVKIAYPKFQATNPSATHADIIKMCSVEYRRTHKVAPAPIKSVCWKLPEGECLNKPLCSYVKPVKANKNTQKIRQPYCFRSAFKNTKDIAFPEMSKNVLYGNTIYKDHSQMTRLQAKNFYATVIVGEEEE